MMKKRRLKRSNLTYYLQVFDRNTDNLMGRLVDITTEGIMLISENAIQTGKVFQFKMKFFEAFEGKSDITFEAKSLWCKKEDNTKYYDTGFSLIDVSDENIKIIEDLIQWFNM